jgi:hypothetical protein
MDSKKTTITVIVLSLITLGAYYIFNKKKVATTPNIGTPTLPQNTNTNVNFCDTLGEPLEKYLDKFTWYKSAYYSKDVFPKNCSNYQVTDIVNEPNFGVGDGFKNNLNGGIIISNNVYGTQPVRAYFLRGNIGGIKCKVLMTLDYISAAYYDYDTNELKGYNGGIYFTKDFAKYKCKNIPYIVINGLGNDPIKITIMDKQNPLMLPYLQQAASSYNAFIYGKDWDGSYDLRGADFMKPTSQIESQIAKEAMNAWNDMKMGNNDTNIGTQNETRICSDGAKGVGGRCPEDMS